MKMDLAVKKTEDGDPRIDSPLYVRKRTTCWHDHRGVYSRTELLFLRRKSGSKILFTVEEGLSCSGAEDLLAKIGNLNSCKDGLYLLSMTNAHRDWETGIVDDWDYELTPAEGDK